MDYLEYQLVLLGTNRVGGGLAGSYQVIAPSTRTVLY